MSWWAELLWDFLEYLPRILAAIIRGPGYVLSKIVWRLGNKEPSDAAVWLAGIVFWVVVIGAVILWWRLA